MNELVLGFTALAAVFAGAIIFYVVMERVARQALARGLGW